MKICTKLLLLLAAVFAVSAVASATQVSLPPVATNLTSLTGVPSTDIMFAFGSLGVDGSNNVTDLSGFMGVTPGGDLLMLDASFLTATSVPTDDLNIQDLTTGTTFFLGSLIARSSNTSANSTDILYEFDPPNTPVFGIDLHPFGGVNPTLDFFLVTPEPSSLLLLLSGGAALPYLRRKRKS